MIGPGGFLLVVPTYMQFLLQFYWWGCQKKNLNFDINFVIHSDILSTGGDALTLEDGRASLLGVRQKFSSERVQAVTIL
jgi:hypothetical protein